MSIRCIIFGFGKTGKACHNILSQLRWPHAIIGSSSILEEVQSGTIVYLENEISESILQSFSVLVRSPGIPSNHPILKKARDIRLEVWSEIELALQINPLGHWIGITGSNGKTTTATITTKLLLSQYNDVRLVGNVGKPLINEVISTTTNSILVVELSSFQLEDTVSFHPEICAITNLSPNHLDHVDSIETYYQSKLKIYQKLTRDDICIINNQNLESIKRVHPESKKILIGHNHLSDYWLSECWVMKGKDPLVQLRNPWLRLGHNQMNAMMALAIADHFGIDPQTSQIVLDSVDSIAHRMELVNEINGIQYINDSKSTTPEATYAARNSLPLERLCHVLIGGRNKHLDFHILKSLPLTKWYIYGESIKEISDQLNVKNGYDTMKSAFDDVILNAKHGDIVLLSPGCSSFDQFSNYEIRGDFFKQIVRDYSNAQPR